MLSALKQRCRLGVYLSPPLGAQWQSISSRITGVHSDSSCPYAPIHLFIPSFLLQFGYHLEPRYTFIYRPFSRFASPHYRSVLPSGSPVVSSMCRRLSENPALCGCLPSLGKLLDGKLSHSTIVIRVSPPITRLYLTLVHSSMSYSVHAQKLSNQSFLSVLTGTLSLSFGLCRLANSSNL